jgi:7-carboxy-7-deazaguanine synthase
MRIAELFASIQGEGMLAGMPSLFIRVSGCNLRCAWCDTPYASWKPEGDEMTIGQIVAWIAHYPSYRHAVITGGEPLLFTETAALTQALRARGLHVTIETAGTLWQDGLACDLMSLSPKLANSTPTEARWSERHERARFQPEVLQRLTREFEYQLKFVLQSAEDLGEIQRIQKLCGAPAGRVLLMGEGIDAPTLAARDEWLVALCQLHGYRYTPRLHVLLWGSRRGV